MEELTKSQIVLLVLLVSFVTSIATGIVTVSLLAQAPPAITQTVNRIVERTIETVVPAENSQTASVITKEITTVVKEEDLITDSIAQSFARVGRIHEGVSTTSPIIALGVLVSGGRLVTDASMVSALHAVSFPDSSTVFEVTGVNSDQGIAVMTATGSPLTLSPLRVLGTGSVKLGQTVIALSGMRSDRAFLGTVAARGAGTVDTSVDEAVNAGAPLVSAYGEVVGISTAMSRFSGSGSFTLLADALVFFDTPVATTTAAR